MAQNILEKIGKQTIKFFVETGQISILLGRVFLSLKRMNKNSIRNLFSQMEHIGVNSLPLVIIIATFTGAVAAWQAAYQLKGLAPLSFLGTATSRAIITELGPVLTAIIIAGRVGASIAAELGSMKVTEQIDALEVMGIAKEYYLAMPRIISSIIMMPILIIFADTIAIIGAFFISNLFLNVSADVFFTSVQRFFEISDLLFGMFKGFVFGGITSLLGCHIGFNTEGGAEGVGKSTIRAFVLSAALILISDYLMWALVF